MKNSDVKIRKYKPKKKFNALRVKIGSVVFFTGMFAAIGVGAFTYLLTEIILFVIELTIYPSINQYFYHSLSFLYAIYASGIYYEMRLEKETKGLIREAFLVSSIVVLILFLLNAILGGVKV